MTDEEIAVKLTALEHETKSAKHRLDDLEIQTRAIQDLALSVKELTINMSNMLREQKKQGERLTKLEREPADQWNTIKRTAITAIVSAVAGAFATGIFVMISQYMR